MTGRRLKAIAAQAVVVGALLIVVSLTLLRSDDGTSLFDIDAPGSETSVGPAGGADNESGGDRPGGETRGGATPGGDSGPAPGAGTASAALPGDGIAPTGPAPLVAPPPSSGDESPADQSPSGDQYLGSVARLNLATE